MRFKVDDGKVIFATHFISAIINHENEGVKQKLAPFQVEKDGIVVYPGQNVFDVEWALQELKIPYTVEKLQHKPEHITKTKGIRYASRTEAIKHLLEDIEPESQTIPNINKTSNILGRQLVNRELENLNFKNENNMLGKTIVDLELRLLKLERSKT